MERQKPKVCMTVGELIAALADFNSSEKIVCSHEEGIVVAVVKHMPNEALRLHLDPNNGTWTH